MQQKNLMTEQELTDKLTRAYDKVMSKQMTEIEQIRQEIKVLEKKLELMEKLKDYKSPAEEAYKEWMGKYPPTDESVDNTDDIRWRAFQMGWMKAQQTYKVGTYQPTPQTPEQVEEGLKQAFREAKKSKEWKDTQKKIDTPIRREEFGDKLIEKDTPNLQKVIDEMVEERKSQTLLNMLKVQLDYDGMVCDDIVDIVEDWILDEQSASGSQNVNTELLVEGFNDAIRKMKEMLR